MALPDLNKKLWTLEQDIYEFESWNPSKSKMRIPQEAIIRLLGKVTTHRYENSPYTFVTLNLAGSTIAAADKGAIALDDGVMGRYWFTEKVEVTIELTEPGEIVILRSEPLNQNRVSQVTSSNQISINLSTGAFGATAVGQPSAGVVIGTSFTRSMQDFRIVSSTNDNRTYRLYAMEASSGGPYSTLRDLADHGPNLNLWHRVPDLARWDLPLCDAVSFRTRHRNRKDRLLKIQIVHTLGGVFGKAAPDFNPFNMFPETATLTTESHTFTHELELPISTLAASDDYVET